MVVLLFPESLIEVDVIAPPLPRVPWIVTESPGRTEWLLTSTDLSMAVVRSSLISTVLPEDSLT